MPRAAAADASLRLLSSPVPAGGVVRLELRTQGELKAPLRGVAALGAVGPFTRTGAGTYQAEYSPPKGTGPALCAIAVFEDRPGGTVAYTLANIADSVRTHARVRGHQTVYVRAGTTRFGPFHPDRRGEVQLQFTANGELTSAELETAQGKPLSALALKPVKVEALAFGRPSHLRPGEALGPELFVLTTYEGALKFEPPRATASAGKVALDLKGSPDYALRYQLTPPAQLAGPLTVSFVDSLGGKVGRATFTPAGPAVASIHIKSPEKSLGPGEHAILDVSLADAQGQGAEGALEVTADYGKIDPPLPLGAGLYNITYTAPERLPESGVAHLRAHLLDGAANATAELHLHGGKPAKVVFHPTSEKPHAGELLSVELQVLDAAGNPADPSDLAIAADHGEVDRLRPESESRFVVDVRADPDAESVMLTARDGKTGLAGEQELSLETAPEMPFALIGPEGGFSNNFGHVSSATIAVAAQFLVGPSATVPVRGTVGFLAGYLPDITQNLTSEHSTPGTLSLSRIPLMARGGTFGAIGNLGLFGGIQAGVMHLDGDLQSVGRATLPLDSWRPAFGLYGGAGYKVGPGYISIEVRATYATVDLQNADVEVAGPVGGVDGAVGYLFTL